jgi:shikimate kinase
MTHIILIGFKHVGKSVLGKQLAAELERPYRDLDEVIEHMHQRRNGVRQSCREIMNERGEEYFRQLEHEALAQVLNELPPAIIAVGGGTPLSPENQKLLRGHQLIHVTASKSRVYERIMVNGRPAFFPKGRNSYLAFNELWQERDMIYRQISKVTIDNSRSLDTTVQALKTFLIAG